MLQQIHKTLWIAEGEIVRFYGAPYPTRSVIARLGNGDLWIWSPVKLSTQLRSAVDQLGPVRYLVSPNKLHHLYLREWKNAYPEASLWGPQSTIRKCADLNFQDALRDERRRNGEAKSTKPGFAARLLWMRTSFCIGRLELPSLLTSFKHLATAS